MSVTPPAIHDPALIKELFDNVYLPLLQKCESQVPKEGLIVNKTEMTQAEGINFLMEGAVSMIVRDEMPDLPEKIYRGDGDYFDLCFAFSASSDLDDLEQKHLKLGNKGNKCRGALSALHEAVLEKGLAAGLASLGATGENAAKARSGKDTGKDLSIT